MSEWKDLLIEIQKIEEKYGSTLRRPASDAELAKMQDTIHQRLGNIDLPESYIEFLKTINGLDFNGLVIYGVDEALLDQNIDEEIHGFIETNELWYENDWQKHYLFFGDSDTAWYCYDKKESKYVEIDKPSATLIQSYDSFDIMLSGALRTALL